MIAVLGASELEASQKTHQNKLLGLLHIEVEFPVHADAIMLLRGTEER